MRFRATWPIEDPTVAECELIHAARKTLRTVTAEAGVHYLDLAEHTWTIEDGHLILTAEHRPDCGTEAGYYRHTSIGVEPCAACHAAHLEYRRQRDTKVCDRCGGRTTRRRNGLCRRCTQAHDHGWPDEELDPVAGWVRRGLVWYPVQQEAGVA